MRIISRPRHPSPISPRAAIDLLGQAREDEHHQLWPCDVSLLDGQVLDVRLLGTWQVTDAYLLVLAVQHGGRLVTFDHSVSLAAVPGRPGTT